MLFASFAYILIFLPIVITLYIAINHFLGSKAARAWVLMASLIFYARSRPINLVFLFVSILINWLLAKWMERETGPARKRVLVAGLTLNVLYLSVFKYLGFFASMVVFLLPHGYVVPSLPFPTGISFFTITQIMYLVDCYENILTAGTLFDHASFVTFFPYVISGPLARAKRIRHQFGEMDRSNGNLGQSLARGLFLFSLGLFKKCVFADPFARVAHFGRTPTYPLSALETWMFSVAYTMQIYFDFSGYSDMAIGSAMMLGIEIPRNFDAPFRSRSIIEFWQRWHISLTNFITSYLYTPIVRSFRKPTLTTAVVSTFIAMAIAGLWHGANWTFIVFGCLHGAYLGINQIWRKKKMPKIPTFFSWMLTFLAVVIGFVFFGSDSLRDAVTHIMDLINPVAPFSTRNIVSMNGIEIDLHVYGVPLLLGVIIAIWGSSSEQRAREFRPTAWNCACAAGCILTAFVLLNSSVSKPFVYFRF